MAGNKFEMTFNQGEVGSRFIDLVQCERVLLCHVHVIAQRAYSIVKPQLTRLIDEAPATGRMKSNSAATACMRASNRHARMSRPRDTRSFGAARQGTENSPGTGEMPMHHHGPSSATMRKFGRPRMGTQWRGRPNRVLDRAG
jgi:hypothetical protein